VFSDSRVSPSFLRTTPAKKPRTECCCQPVAFMMAAIVVPSGLLSSAMTASCLVFEPALGLRPLLLPVPFLTGPLTREVLRIFAELRDMLGSFRLQRHLAPSPPKPRNGRMAGGVDPRTGNNPCPGPHSSAPLASECQSFLR